MSQNFDFADVPIDQRKKCCIQNANKVCTEGCPPNAGCGTSCFPQVMQVPLGNGCNGGGNMVFLLPANPPAPDCDDDSLDDRSREHSRSYLDQTADLPLQQLAIVPADGMYTIDCGLYNKVTDSGGGTLDYGFQFTSPTSAPGLTSPQSSTQSSGSLGGGFVGSIPSSQAAFLLKGTPVLFHVTGGSYLNGGVYNFWIRLLRMSPNYSYAA